MKKSLVCLLMCIFVLGFGCAAPKIKLFPDATEPLREFAITGEADEKVLVVSIRGVISERPRWRLFEKPSMVQEIVSQLRMAEKDTRIKAVLFKVDTPGGSVTASDILYHELMNFKKLSAAKIVVAMMGLATSGGYYVSLPADYIFAHPTTVTGSIGTILMIPKVDGLMEKIGVGVDVHKSGENKDILSPLRPSTDEEREILQDLTNALGQRFIQLVKNHRNLDEEKLAKIATARVYLAQEARELGLVDEIGYLSDALSKAKEIAGLPANARIVVYRRTEYANDNLYNPATLQSGGMDLSIVNLDLPAVSTTLDSGFYYLWLPAADQD